MLHRLTLPGSVYRERADATLGNNAPFSIGILVAAVEALRDDLRMGWSTTVAELLHAETFGGFIDMATELLDKGYKDPAAVLTGSDLESHLRLLCAKHGVGATRANGQSKKADVMNTDLVKAGLYNTMVQKQVTADLGVRNHAAHGEYSEYDDARVKLMIASVSNYLAAHPA